MTQNTIIPAGDSPAGPTQELAALALAARNEFGVAVFWSIPELADPADEARNVGRALAKHGGLKGLRMAATIEQALAAAGQPSWR